jgi:hypothetical protein
MFKFINELSIEIPLTLFIWLSKGNDACVLVLQPTNTIQVPQASDVLGGGEGSIPRQ